MNTTQEPEVKKTKLTGKALQDTIIANLLKALGKPENLFKVKALNVFDNRWRVDVWSKLGESAGIVRALITDSFFLHVNDEGKILGPAIEKKYK